MNLRRLLRSATMALTLVGCGHAAHSVPGVLSPLPFPAAAVFRAGLGRADITPPAQVGLGGNGPEGAKANGQRQRLYARALVLEDARGSRLAIVVADLPLSSALLHRRVAGLIEPQTRIGVDRLIISATHTHSGPGHYFEAKVYNEEGSSVVGFDPVMLDSLARRIQGAVEAAVADLRRAHVVWGSRNVWGFTRIRSLPAMIRNLPQPQALPDAPTGLLPEYRLVDPEMSMLRIDQWDAAAGAFRPAGAFTIFAMHGTGNASGTELLDGDIHGLVARRLERHIDSLTHPGQWPFVPRSVHLFANGTEGDVSPAWTPQSRCNTPTLTPLPLLDGPFTPFLWQWKPNTPTHLAACIHAARQGVELIGEGVGRAAVALYDSLQPASADGWELSRAFTTLPLQDTVRVRGICPTPAIGMSALVGAADAHTRMNGWRILGALPVGLEEGPNSPNPNTPGCHAQKHTLLDVLLGSFPVPLIAGGFPSHAQLTVFRIGNRIVGTLPAEVTTTAGRRMRTAMLSAARSSGIAVDAALIVGLTNGYLEYITTAEEYTAQYYEGGSTLYGPGEAAMFGRELAALVTELSANTVLPADRLPFSAAPGKPHTILKQRKPGQHGATPVVATPTCSGDSLYAHFSYGAVQDWADSTGTAGTEPRVAVLSGAAVVAWDDDAAIELHLRSLKAYPARWELRWAVPAAGKYRVRVTGAPPSAEVACGGSILR